MLPVYVYAIGSVLLISLISLAGITTLLLRENLLRRGVLILVSLAIGALLGDVFVHIIPEAFEEAGNPTLVSLGVIAGILIFFLLEKVLHWHHHAGTESIEPNPHPAGRMILVSDSVHNFIDGLIVGASYLVSIEVGIATTIAVILHEIPQEIGNFGVLLHSGYTKAKALWYNFLSALTSVVGAVIALLIGAAIEPFAAWLLTITAGGFVYIALSDLIPELHKSKSVSGTLVQLLAIGLGVAAMVSLLALEG